MLVTFFFLGTVEKRRGGGQQPHVMHTAVYSSSTWLISAESRLCTLKNVPAKVLVSRFFRLIIIMLLYSRPAQGAGKGENFSSFRQKKAEIIVKKRGKKNK